MAALVCIKKYYPGAQVPLPPNPEIKLPVAGLSIPAAEHSTITSWGRDGEVDAFRNMLTQYPKGLMACVSDSYNIWSAATDKWGSALKEQVLAQFTQQRSKLPYVTLLTGLLPGVSRRKTPAPGVCRRETPAPGVSRRETPSAAHSML